MRTRSGLENGVGVDFLKTWNGWPEELTPKPFLRAHIAQMVEHSLGKGEVTGSIPVVGTT